MSKQTSSTMMFPFLCHRQLNHKKLGYVQSEVHFNTAESIDTPQSPDLNISNDSIDSYMGDIGDSHFITLVNPSLPFDQPCCSHDLIPAPSIPSIYEIAPTYPRYTPFNYQYPPISYASSPISSESSSPPVDSGNFPTATHINCGQIEPVCVMCKQACSDAHRCPGCKSQPTTINVCEQNKS